MRDNRLMKKSVQIIKIRGNTLTVDKGKIVREIISILNKYFPPETVAGICDDIGSLLIPYGDITAEEWIEYMLEDK